MLINYDRSMASLASYLNKLPKKTARFFWVTF